MSEFFEHAITVAFGISMWELVGWFFNKHQPTYRWKCRYCSFKIKTKSLDTYNISRSSHNHSSTREYK